MTAVRVAFTPGGLRATDLAGRTVLVIDVLRATTTIATALAHGARAVVPCATPEEVVARARAFDRGDVVLAGERRNVPPAGFDLGNSPREYTRDRVAGRTVLLSTTNGTGAVLATHGARDVAVGSYVNFTASLAFLREAVRGGRDVTIVCAGREGAFALEDAACAGRYVRRLARGHASLVLDDAARTAALLDQTNASDPARILAGSDHGRTLAGGGFADDLAACAALDAAPVVPVLRDGRLVRLDDALGA